jgi:hypothetical protein
MLGHRLPRHGEAFAKLVQGLPILGAQAIEQLTPRRISQRLEHQIHGDNMQPFGCLSRHEYAEPRSASVVCG